MTRWILNPTKHTIHLPYPTGEEDEGFFHVTSHSYELQKRGEYLSRRQLSSEGIVGLGGGPNDAPDLVSLVIDLEDAKRILRAMRSMSRAVHELISPNDLIREMLDWTSFPDGMEWQDAMSDTFGMNGFSEPEWNEDADAFFSELMNALSIDETDVLSEELFSKAGWDLVLKKDFSWMGPRDVYEMVQDFEGILARGVGTSYQGKGSECPGACLPVVGFVGSFDSFLKIEPDNISISQAALMEGAKVDEFYPECEIRVRPENLKLVRVRVEESGVLMTSDGMLPDDL